MHFSGFFIYTCGFLGFPKFSSGFEGSGTPKAPYFSNSDSNWHFTPNHPPPRTLKLNAQNQIILFAYKAVFSGDVKTRVTKTFSSNCPPPQLKNILRTALLSMLHMHASCACVASYALYAFNSCYVSYVSYVSYASYASHASCAYYACVI